MIISFLGEKDVKTDPVLCDKLNSPLQLNSEKLCSEEFFFAQLDSEDAVYTAIFVLYGINFRLVQP